MIRAVPHVDVQAIRDAFAPLARWSGLPIIPDRIVGDRLLSGIGEPSVLKVEGAMIGADGALDPHACYTPSLRRFAIYPLGDRGRWRVSENTIGAMENPTSLSDSDFARECYLYLRALERGEEFEAAWLDEPQLWPQKITRPKDLKVARRAIPDLRPTEIVVHVHVMFSEESYVARAVAGASWRELDWRTADGERVTPVPATEGRVVGAVRTWRIFLRSFLDHAVPFSLDAEGRRANGSTKGRLVPTPIRIIGVTRTGRTDWAGGVPAEELLPDPERWARLLEGLDGLSGSELRRGGLAPRTARAMRAGRRPVARNAAAAHRLVERRARAAAGLAPDRDDRCLAPGCDERLSGRRRSFCAIHATYPGSRRKGWREAAAR